MDTEAKLTHYKVKTEKTEKVGKAKEHRLSCAGKCPGYFRKTLLSIRRYGLFSTIQLINYKLIGFDAAREIAKQDLFTKEELNEQRSHVFPKKIRFSIIVPLYNTPERFLREMIDSVLAQTYSELELCMADGSDAEHSDVEKICAEYANKDRRIRYMRLDKNYGISGNTNKCIEMVTGDYIALFDHDDLLHPAALYEVMNAVCEKNADFVYTDEVIFRDTPRDAFNPHFKPCFAPDTLCSNNYICHFTVFKRELLNETGLFEPLCDGSQDHDLVLRLTEKARKIVHIPEILYYWRAHANSVAENVGIKPYVTEAGVRAVKRRLERLGLEGEVTPVKEGMTIYRVRYKIIGQPKVSVVIPDCDGIRALKRCVNSLYGRSSYENFEIIIVGNNSRSKNTSEYCDAIGREHDNIKIVSCDGELGFAALCNFGAKHCTGDHILFLNSNTEVIASDWIQEMLMFSQRSDVGAVGAKLIYSDRTIRHAGIGIDQSGSLTYFFRGVDRGYIGYMGRLIYVQNVSAVSSACMMVRRDVWEKMNGFDESFAAELSGADLCMRIRKAGYLIVWTPFAELYDRSAWNRHKQKKERSEAETIRFKRRRETEIELGDPYFNPNFCRHKERFMFDTNVRRHSSR